MSYILDALRKSERERQTGQVPGLPNLVSDSDNKSPRWLFWLVGLLLLINLGGVAYWLFLRAGQEGTQAPVVASPGAPSPLIPSAAQADQAMTTSVVNAGTPSQGQASVTMAVPTAPALVAPHPVQPVGPSVMPAAPVAPQVVPPMVGSASVPVSPKGVASVPTQSQPTPQIQVPAAGMAESPVSVAPPSSASTARTVQSVPPAVYQPDSSAAAVPAPSGASRELPYFPPKNPPSSRPSPFRTPSSQEEDFDAVDAEMEAEGEPRAEARSYDRAPQSPSVRHGIRTGTPHLSDLPVEFQEKVPPFKITMFAYSKYPAERFVIIDMKKSRVGDRLPGGILLLEIQSENLVLELDGQKFMIPRN